MQYQRAPLAAEHEYFLDCACESDEINAFDHAVLTLLGDRAIVGQIMDDDAGRDGRRPLRFRIAKCLRLDAYAHEIVADLSPSDQRTFAAVGLQREPLRLHRLAEYLANFNFEDQTLGGAAMDFRRYRRCDRNFDPTPRARRHLYSPRSIGRYIKMEYDSLPSAERLAAGLRRLPVCAPDEVALVNDLLREQRESHRQEYAASRAAFLEEQRKRWGFHGPRIAPVQRRAVARAARFAAGLIGDRQVGSFARGEAITLPGQTFNLIVARRTSVAAAGHGALDVRLCATDGLPLASVCVYFDKTPALDQVAALAMHMNSGEESTVIRTGNLFAITAAGADHPVVKERLAQRAPIDPEDQAAMDRLLRHGLGQNDYDRKRAAVERYTTGTLGVYLNAVMTRVWGRDAGRLVTFSERYIERNHPAEMERLAA